MGEVNNASEDEVKNANAEDKGAANQDESQNDSGADTGAEGANKSDNENGKGADKGGNSADKKGEDQTNPNANEEPKTRKRNADFIIERKNRKIEKLNKEKGGAASEEEDESNEDEDEDIDAEDAKIIDKRVIKAMSPFIQKQMQEEDAKEISDFVKTNPDFAPYADKVKKFAQHPSRREMPIESIFYEVAGPDLLKLGAKREKVASDLAKESGAGGSAEVGGDSEKTVWDLTPAEFIAKQEEIRQKRRD